LVKDLGFVVLWRGFREQGLGCIGYSCQSLCDRMPHLDQGLGLGFRVQGYRVQGDKVQD
jgi:hypothetical protein